MFTKDLIRSKMKELRMEVTHKELETAANSIKNKICNLDVYKKMDNILIYVSSQWEMPTKNLIEHMLSQGKNIYVPKVLKKGVMDFYKISSLDDVSLGAFRILEPTTKDVYVGDIALMILPGLAFDKNKNRLGYGGGYYDRYLSNAKNISTVGIGFDFQITNSLPTEETDYILDMVLTPNYMIC